MGADLSILDEIDSGLDVDALRDVARAVNGLLTPKNSVLMITHYLRLLEFIKPSYIHVMVSHLEQIDYLKVGRECTTCWSCEMEDKKGSKIMKLAICDIKSTS